MLKLLQMDNTTSVKYANILELHNIVLANVYIQNMKSSRDYVIYMGIRINRQFSVFE